MTITLPQSTIILGVSTYVGTAVISTMPPKDAEWNWRTLYCWCFDCAHMLLNSRPTKDAVKELVTASQ